MVLKGGASFQIDLASLQSGSVRERCVNCHGSRSKNSVRRVHADDQDQALLEQLRRGSRRLACHADARPRRAARCARITHGAALPADTLVDWSCGWQAKNLLALNWLGNQKLDRPPTRNQVEILILE